MADTKSRSSLPFNPIHGDMSQWDGQEWRRLTANKVNGVLPIYNASTGLMEMRKIIPSDLVPGASPGDIIIVGPGGGFVSLSDVAIGQVLTSGGVGNPPVWSPNPRVTGYIRAGSASVPVNGIPGDVVAGRFLLNDDANFFIQPQAVTGNPFFVVDANDYFNYARSTNTYGWAVGGSAVMQLDGAGNLANAGYLRVGSFALPVGGNPGDLIAARIFVNNDLNYALSFSGANPILSFDNNDYISYIRASNAWNFVVAGALQMYLDGSGNLLNAGYQRVGSTAAPANTTAGDLTAVRYFVNNDSFFSLWFSGPNPVLDFDNGDFFAYIRASNLFQWAVGNAQIAFLDGAGNWGNIGYSNIGTQAVRGGAAGDLTFGRGFAVQGLAIDTPGSGYVPDANSKLIINRLNNGGTVNNNPMLINEQGSADPRIEMDIAGVTGWVVGVDNSDGDCLKLTATTGTGDFQSTNGIRITPSGLLRFQFYGAGTLSTDASGNVSASDERLKNVVGPMPEGLAEVLQLNPVLYTWKKAEDLAEPLRKLYIGEGEVQDPRPVDTTVHAGFIAQEVQAEIPEAVGGSGELEILNIDDRSLIGALVNAIKELSARVEQLEAAAAP